MDLIINEEFKQLIPPLTTEEFKQLEDNCCKEGIREKILIWKGIVIDGHNRYKIAETWGLEYKTQSMHFNNESEVKEWMILNQFGRRNLNKYQRSTLALKLENVFQEQAKDNLVKSGENFGKGSVNSPKPIDAVDTRKQLSKVANVGEQTISRVKKIQEKATPELKEQLEKGEVSINQAYKEVTGKKTHVSNNTGNNEWYTPNPFIEAARKAMGSIDLDPASSEIANKTVKAIEFYTKEENGLSFSWKGNVWLNPPYAQPLISEFSDKVISEIENYNSICVLVNNATETKWFQQIMEVCNCVCFVKKRIKFLAPNGEASGAPLQGQAILYIGNNVNEFITEFNNFGVCLIRKKD